MNEPPVCQLSVNQGEEAPQQGENGVLPVRLEENLERIMP